MGNPIPLAEGRFVDNTGVLLDAGGRPLHQLWSGFSSWPDQKHAGAPPLTDLVCFGDSIAAKVGFGTGVTDAQMHMTKLSDWATSVGITPRGEGINGGTFPQYLRSFSTTTPLTSSTILCGHSGFNVMTGNTLTAGLSPTLKRDLWKLTEAMALWMLIPEDKKVRLRNPTDGTAINSTSQVQVVNGGGSIGNFNSLSTNFARNSSGTGSTITFTLEGTHLYFWYGRDNGNSGTFTISVDGGPIVEFDTTLSYDPRYSAESGAFAMDVAKFEGLPSGTHTMVVTVTAHANVFYGAAALNPFTTVGPTLLLGSCLYTNTYEQVSTATTGATGAAVWLTNEGAVDWQNTMERNLIASLRERGYLAYFIDNTSDYVVPTEITADNIHPKAGRHELMYRRYRHQIARIQAVRSNA